MRKTPLAESRGPPATASLTPKGKQVTAAKTLQMEGQALCDLASLAEMQTGSAGRASYGDVHIKLKEPVQKRRRSSTASSRSSSISLPSDDRLRSHLCKSY